MNNREQQIHDLRHAHVTKQSPLTKMGDAIAQARHGRGSSQPLPWRNSTVSIEIARDIRAPLHPDDQLRAQGRLALPLPQAKRKVRRHSFVPCEHKNHTRVDDHFIKCHDCRMLLGHPLPIKLFEYAAMLEGRWLPHTTDREPDAEHRVASYADIYVSETLRLRRTPWPPGHFHFLVKFPKSWVRTTIFFSTHYAKVAHALAPLIRTNDPLALWTAAQCAIVGDAWARSSTYLVTKYL